MHTKKITRNRLDWRGSWMCRSKVYRPTGVIGPFAFRKPTKFAFSGIRAAFGSACRFAQWYCLWEVEHLRSVLRLSKICTLTPQVGLRLIGHFSPSLFFSGVRQGYPISPFLLNFFVDFLQTALSGPLDFEVKLLQGKRFLLEVCHWQLLVDWRRMGSSARVRALGYQSIPIWYVLCTFKMQAIALRSPRPCDDPLEIVSGFRYLRNLITHGEIVRAEVTSGSGQLSRTCDIYVIAKTSGFPLRGQCTMPQSVLPCFTVARVDLSILGTPGGFLF